MSDAEVRNDISAEEAKEMALDLISFIMDNHTENTIKDRSYRNCARYFLKLYADEVVEFEDENDND